MDLPKKFKMLSDDTELELVETILLDKKSKEKAGVYLYTKAKVLKGKTITLPLNQITYLQSCNLLKVLGK